MNDQEEEVTVTDTEPNKTIYIPVLADDRLKKQRSRLILMVLSNLRVGYLEPHTQVFLSCFPFLFCSVHINASANESMGLVVSRISSTSTDLNCFSSWDTKRITASR